MYIPLPMKTINKNKDECAMHYISVKLVNIDMNIYIYIYITEAQRRGREGELTLLVIRMNAKPELLEWREEGVKPPHGHGVGNKNYICSYLNIEPIFGVHSLFHLRSFVNHSCFMSFLFLLLPCLCPHKSQSCI